MKLLTCPYCNSIPYIQYFNLSSKQTLVSNSKFKVKIKCKNKYCLVRPETNILNKNIALKYWNQRNRIRKFLNFITFNKKCCKFCGKPMTITKIHVNIKKYYMFCSNCHDKIKTKIQPYRNERILLQNWKFN